MTVSADFSAAAELGRHSGTQLQHGGLGRGDFSLEHVDLCSRLAVVFWFLKAWYAE